MITRGSASEPPDRGAAAADVEADVESVARTIGLRLLTGAPRSRKQLADAMVRRGVPDEVAVRVLDRFAEVGLIDDAEYARMFILSKRASRGLGRRALAAELRTKGVGDEEAAQALAEVDDEAEEETARDLVRRTWRSDTDPATQTRRMLASLARKGYSYGLSRRVVAEMRDDGTDLGREDVDLGD